MNLITEARADIKTVLEATGYPVHDYLPERVNAPCLALVHGEPYAQMGPVFGEYTIRLQVICVARVSTNKVSTENLDQMIVETQEALYPDYAAPTVTQVAVEPFSGTNLYTCALPVETHYRKEDD